MPYIADMRKLNTLVEAKQLVGNGQCVSLIHAVAVVPGATAWHRGDAVKGNKNVLPGTIIATFDEKSARYGNRDDGTSHAAIFLYQAANGIGVIDQWKGHTQKQDHQPQQRTIYFKHTGDKVDQGDQYYVVH